MEQIKTLPKIKEWQRNPLKGFVLVTRKIDGVQGVFDGEVWRSRNNKPLYNLPIVAEAGVYEIFLGSWEASVSACRTLKGTPIQAVNLFRLDFVDNRLVIGIFKNPSTEKIESLFKTALLEGFEGLVLFSSDGAFKIKKEVTYDTKILGVEKGGGKYSELVGRVRTPLGFVGTGFTDVERGLLLDPAYLDTTIEVACMGLTPSGKFRHPRFKRFRFDKDT